MKFKIVFMVCLLWVGFTRAADYYFLDNSGDHKWTNETNWSPSGPPTIADFAYFDEDYESTGKYCLIEPGDDITFARLRMSSVDTAKHTYIKMTGGTLHATQGIDLGYYHFYDNSFCAARFEQFGGTVISDDFWRVGYRTGLSEWILHDGSVTCNRILFQTDPQAYSRIIVGNGYFSVKGDQTAAMQAFFGTTILPYDNQGVLTAVYDASARGGLGETVVKRIVRASQPQPINEAVDVPSDVVLSWMPNTNTMASNVYFGSDYEAIVHADTNSSEFMGSTTVNQYPLSRLDFGQTYYWRIDLVSPDDSVVRGFTWSFKVTQSITDIAVSASSQYSAARAVEYAIDGSGLIGLVHTNLNSYTMWQDIDISEFPKWFKLDLKKTYSNVQLKIWNYNWAGYISRGVRKLDVYIAEGSDDPDNPVDQPKNWYPAVIDVTLTQAPGTDNYDTPDTIDIGDQKCRWVALKLNRSWGGGYGGLSEVQVFADSIDQACNPAPSNESTDVPVNTSLQWLKGGGVVLSHNVYFGTDYQQVADAADPFVYPGAGVYQESTYVPPVLANDTDYYWRVDQRYSDGTIVAGVMWHFKTALFEALPQKAVAISPAIDGFSGIYEKLLWYADAPSQSYKVYLSDNYLDVYNAADPYSYPGIGVTADDNLAIPALEYGKDYYWRIDVQNQSGTTKGDVWHFATFDAPASLDEYFVDVNGSDNNPGTLDQPFATLTRARDAVRFAKSDNASRDITVWLRGGEYALTDTFELSQADSGSGIYKVTYSSYPGEIAVLTSDVRLDSWQRLAAEQEPAGLPSAATGKLWIADIPRNAVNFRMMYAGDQELPRARAQGFIPLDPGNDKSSRSRLYCPAGVLSDWQNLSDVELVIRPDVPYAMNILPVKAVDMTAGILTTLFPSENYLLPLRPNDEPAPDASAWIENVPQGMLEPGNWFYDSAAGKVYLWFDQQGGEPSDVRVGALCNYIEVAGDEPSGVPVRNLSFNRIRFTRGNRYTIIGNEYSEKVQHGWEFYDSDDAMLRFRWASGCKVNRCEFVNTGGTAIRLDQYARMIEISDCNFDDIGGTAIFLCGPDDTSLVNQYNKIYNNRITNTGQKYWNGHGILVYQSQSNYIARNLTADTPYTAITITGSRDNTTSNNNLIEGNEVYNTCTALGDGNGIYVRFAGIGNIIRSNFVHNIYASGSHGAIRCDNSQANVTVEGNIINKCAYTGIIIKEYNIVRNNMIVDLYQPGDEGFDWAIEPRGFLLLRPDVSCDDAVISNNVFYNSGDIVNFYEDNSQKLTTCVVDNNLFYSSQDTSFTDNYLASLQSIGLDLHSLSADPLFEDIDNFVLNNSSPAFSLGFMQPVINDMGLKPIADLNRDMIVDINDFSLFSKYWINDAVKADISPLTGDGVIDVLDIIEIADNWLN